MFLGKIVEKTLGLNVLLNMVPKLIVIQIPKWDFFYLRIANFKVHGSKYSNMPYGRPLRKEF